MAQPAKAIAGRPGDRARVTDVAAIGALADAAAGARERPGAEPGQGPPPFAASVINAPVDIDQAGRQSLHVDALAGTLLTFGLLSALLIPAWFASLGFGMSPQPDEVVFDTTKASILSLAVSLLVVRRILTFPLLRSITYIFLAFAAVFLATGGFLKLFRITVSSPQFYLSMVISIAVVEAFLFLRRRRFRPIFAILPTVDDPEIAGLALARRAICVSLTAVPKDVDDFNGLIADLRHDLDPEWERLLALAALRGIPVFHVKQFHEMLSGRVAVQHLWENTVAGSIPALVYPQIKRAIDILASALLAPLIAPVVLVAAIAIKLETKGPVFFLQERTGYGNRVFRIIKLRTMTQDADATGDAFTAAGDARITRVGAVLRQYRIDELPQVINILLGQMSWIGPRPEAVSLATWYEKEIPFYTYRHIVRPGISGWAQVNQGNVAQIDAARVKLEYDFFYIKHFSFWLDAIIVVKTLRTIVTRSGAR